MAASQCLKCGCRQFESVIKIPLGAPRRIMFIQCCVCGSVVGVQEELGQGPKKILDRAEHKRSTVQLALSTVPNSINTVLKELYG